MVKKHGTKKKKTIKDIKKKLPKKNYWYKKKTMREWEREIEKNSYLFNLPKSETAISNQEGNSTSPLAPLTTPLHINPLLSVWDSRSCVRHIHLSFSLASKVTSTLSLFLLCVPRPFARHGTAPVRKEEGRGVSTREPGFRWGTLGGQREIPWCAG